MRDGFSVFSDWFINTALKFREILTFFFSALDSSAAFWYLREGLDTTLPSGGEKQNSLFHSFIYIFTHKGASFHHPQIEAQRKTCVTHLEKRSAMALCFPRPLSDSSFAVTRKDCVAHDRRLNWPLSISASC